jgi:hypothetical protein
MPGGAPITAYYLLVRQSSRPLRRYVMKVIVLPAILSFLALGSNKKLNNRVDVDKGDELIHPLNCEVHAPRS